MKWEFIFSIDLDKINLANDKNVEKDDPETVIHLKLLAWNNKFEKRKALKKDTSKELMLGAWLSIR